MAGQVRRNPGLRARLLWTGGMALLRLDGWGDMRRVLRTKTLTLRYQDRIIDCQGS